MRDYIIEYKKYRLINIAKEHYFDNKTEFQNILKETKVISFINELSVLNDNIVEIEIQDTTSVDENFYCQNIYFNDDFPVIDIDFFDSSKIRVKYIDTAIVYRNKWSLRISSKNTQVFQKVIIGYLHLDIKTIENLTELLNKVNCNAISKNNDGLAIRYWGIYGENIEYYYTDRKLEIKQGYNYSSTKLENNVYLYYEDGSLVDFAGSYYFYRFDI